MNSKILDLCFKINQMEISARISKQGAYSNFCNVDFWEVYCVGDWEFYTIYIKRRFFEKRRNKCI